MKPTPVLVLVAVLALTGCLANPSRKSEAGDLRAELAALPHVAGAVLDYTEPITLDSGKLLLTVTMEAKADAASVVDVVGTAYAAFADVHREEEADLDVLVGDDRVHLRSFEPVAADEAVRTATRNAFEVLDSGAVVAELNTQDVAARPHVSTSFLVAVAEPGRQALLRKVAQLTASHSASPAAEWRVQSGGTHGWLIRSSAGLPGTRELALFSALSERVPPGAAVQMYDDDSVVVQVPADASAREVSRMAGRHLGLLGGLAKTFYHVEMGPDFALMNARGDCTFDTGRLGARLEQDFGAQCTKVTHPEDFEVSEQE